MCVFSVSDSNLPRKQKREQVDSERMGNKCDGARVAGLQAFVIWYNHFRGKEIMNYGYNFEKRENNCMGVDSNTFTSVKRQDRSEIFSFLGSLKRALKETPLWFLFRK